MTLFTWRTFRRTASAVLLIAAVWRAIVEQRARSIENHRIEMNAMRVELEGAAAMAVVAFARDGSFPVDRSRYRPSVRGHELLVTPVTNGGVRLETRDERGRGCFATVEAAADGRSRQGPITCSDP